MDSNVTRPLLRVRDVAERLEQSERSVRCNLVLVSFRERVRGAELALPAAVGARRRPTVVD